MEVTVRGNSKSDVCLFVTHLSSVLYVNIYNGQ